MIDRTQIEIGTLYTVVGMHVAHALVHVVHATNEPLVKDGYGSGCVWMHGGCVRVAVVVDLWHVPMLYCTVAASSSHGHVLKYSKRELICGCSTP